jgi:hypothetical protein
MASPNVEMPMFVSKRGISQSTEVALNQPPASPRLKLAKRSPSANVCTSEVCQTYAKQIKANLAKNYATIDPCVDMDMYACQGWRDSHDYRSDQNGES